jgi:hypothetical protein
MDEGVLEISGIVNPEALSRHRVVMVGVKLKTRPGSGRERNLVNCGASFPQAL